MHFRRGMEPRWRAAVLEEKKNSENGNDIQHDFALTAHKRPFQLTCFFNYFMN